MSDEFIAANFFPSQRPMTGFDTDQISSGSESDRVAFPELWRKALTGIVLFEIPLQLDTYLFHNLEDAQFGAISGFNISLTTICLFLLYLQWLPGQIVASARILFSRTLLIYIAVSAISILWAADRARTSFDLIMLLQAFLIFVYFLNNTRTRSDVLSAITFLTIGLLIQGTLMVAVRFLDREISFGPIEFGISEIDHRVTGSFGSPNVACSFIAMVLTPSLSLLFVPVSRYLKLLAITAIILGSTALVLTMSRGGWLAAAFSLAIFLTVAFRRGWLSRTKFALTVMCAAIFAAAFLPILASRLLGDDAGSAASRIPLNEIATSMIVDHPWGVGANNWDLVAQRYADQGRFREEWFYTVHNKYLLVCAELGWIGLIAFVAFLGSILTLGWRAVSRGDRWVSPFALGLTTAFCGQLIHMSFDIFNSRSQVELICLVAALITVLANLPATQDAIGSGPVQAPAAGHPPGMDS